MASSEQYSPEQVLTMGRSAEAAGNLDYALKVYAYLAEHFGDTPEAMVARHGQQRIISWQRAEMARQNGGPPALNVQAGRADRAHDAANQRPPPLSNRLEALRSALPPEPVQREMQARPAEHQGVGNSIPPPLEPARNRPVPHGSRYQQAARENQGNVHQGQAHQGHFGHGGAGSHQPVAREHSTPSTGLVPAEPGLPRMIARSVGENDEAIDHNTYRRYRVGSFLASFMAVMGWLAVLGGLIMLSAMFSGFGAAAVPSLGRPGGFDLSIGSEIGAAAFVFGLLAVFVSQIAHALFDQANASLALLVIEQSRGDY